jgi:hypothetical protein
MPKVCVCTLSSRTPLPLNSPETLGVIHVIHFDEQADRALWGFQVSGHCGEYTLGLGEIYAYSISCYFVNPIGSKFCQ